jgi:hypothetical protein
MHHEGDFPRTAFLSYHTGTIAQCLPLFRTDALRFSQGGLENSTFDLELLSREETVTQASKQRRFGGVLGEP